MCGGLCGNGRLARSTERSEAISVGWLLAGNFTTDDSRNCYPVATPHAHSPRTPRPSLTPPPTPPPPRPLRRPPPRPGRPHPRVRPTPRVHFDPPDRR